MVSFRRKKEETNVIFLVAFFSFINFREVFNLYSLFQPFAIL
jgi:hypothetical protein